MCLETGLWPNTKAREKKTRERVICVVTGPENFFHRTMKAPSGIFLRKAQNNFLLEIFFTARVLESLSRYAPRDSGALSARQLAQSLFSEHTSRSCGRLRVKSKRLLEH